MSAEFRRILAAEAVSNFGSMLSRLAIPWLATLALDATPFEMGMLLVADVAAGAAAALLLGAMVDRHGKRATMLAADGARAGVFGVAAALAWTGQLSFWMLILAAAASGLLTMMFELAQSAWVAQSTDAAQLPTRNSQMSAAASLSETAAFALGGWLYQWLGAVMALVIDAISYLVSAVFVSGVRETPVARTPPQRPRERVRALVLDARAGIAAVAGTPALRVLASVQVLLALGMSLAGTSYMIFVTREVGFEVGVLGMIFASGGIGALGAAWLAPSLGRRMGHGEAMRLGLAMLALGTACISLAPGPTLAGAALLIAHQVIGDAGHTVFNIYDRTLRQTAVGPELLARVDAGIRTLGQAAVLVGAIGGGAIATAIGTRHALQLSAALLAAAAMLLYLRPIAPQVRSAR